MLDEGERMEEEVNVLDQQQPTSTTHKNQM
jgi:hypothetical protein